MTNQTVSRTRKTAAIIISLPILLFWVTFDLVKLPCLIVFAPIWGLMDLIFWLRGEKSLLFSMLAEMSVMGISLWMELVGIRQPRWMGGL